MSLSTPKINSQVRSKQRVADHGEVFTPDWMVKAMLDLVKDETERIDSRFLEPACVSLERVVTYAFPYFLSKLGFLLKERALLRVSHMQLFFRSVIMPFHRIVLTPSGTLIVN